MDFAPPAPRAREAAAVVAGLCAVGVSSRLYALLFVVYAGRACLTSVWSCCPSDKNGSVRRYGSHQGSVSGGTRCPASVYPLAAVHAQANAKRAGRLLDPKAHAGQSS